MTAAERDPLAERAEAHPAKPALVDDRPDSFAELNAMVNRIANSLVASGFGRGQRLVWAGRNSIEVVAIQNAARKAGGFSISVNHRLTQSEVATILRLAEPTRIFAQGAHRNLFEGVPEVVIFDGEAGPGQIPLDEFTAGASAEEPAPRRVSVTGFEAILTLTSGTTGLPKAVLRHHGLSDAEAGLQSKLLGEGEGVFIVTGSLSHSGPNGMATHSLLIGGTIVLQHRFDAEDWVRLVDKYRATNSYSAPFPVRKICDLSSEVRGRYDTASLQTMIAAAAQWPHSLKEEFLSAFPDCDLWELYGSSELATVTVLKPTDQLRKPGSCGKPAPGVEVILVDEDGELVTKPHQPGLLYAKSASVCDAYVGDSEAFEAARRGDFMTVGDVAYADEDGYYYICDREKDMLISGGVNIYPKEIENVLESCPGVFESAVIGVPDIEWGERPHALVVLRDGAKLTEEQIRSHCRTHLASYKVPSVEFASELPHLLSGKVAKREIRAEFLSRSSA